MENLASLVLFPFYETPVTKSYSSSTVFFLIFHGVSVWVGFVTELRVVHVWRINWKLFLVNKKFLPISGGFFNMFFGYSLPYRLNWFYCWLFNVYWPDFKGFLSRLKVCMRCRLPTFLIFLNFLFKLLFFTFRSDHFIFNCILCISNHLNFCFVGDSSWVENSVHVLGILLKKLVHGYIFK